MVRSGSAGGVAEEERLPEQVVAVLQAPVIAHLATCGGDHPHATPVWVACSDPRSIEVNIAASTRKARNLRRNPLVCVSLVAPHDARLWVVIEGTATAVAQTSDRAHLDALARQYLGRPRRNPEMPREIVTIRPVVVHWWGEEEQVEDPAW